MPTKTFFSLSDDKRSRILTVAKNEFSSKRFDDVSINEIIKHAKISRGSFYQYFTDKDDLFGYLVEQDQNDTFVQWRKILISHDGDLFSAFEVFGKKLIDEEVTESERIFSLNMFIFNGNILEKVQQADPGNINFHPVHRQFTNEDFGLDLIDAKNLAVKNQDELVSLLKLLISLLMQIIHTKLRNTHDFDQKRYKDRLDLMVHWLKNGALKGE